MSIQAARLVLSAENIPYSAEYEDVYHADAGALAQARHVFLAGNGLSQRWATHIASNFVIIETGFGLGNNFLATWQAWQEHKLKHPHTYQTLHFISFEKHPFNSDDLAIAHRLSNANTNLSAQLIEQWPMLVRGMHRLHFDNDQVCLTLIFDDIQHAINKLSTHADAIYLDGFTPHKNPQMWSAEVFAGLAKCSNANTTLATWSVSQSVKQGLEQVGFVVRKAPGFGQKREMLCADFPRNGNAPAPSSFLHPRHALVIGAGLAGTSICERLVKRGFTVDLLDAQGVAAGASGNLAGALRPLPSVDDNRIARLTRAGFLYALRHLHKLTQQSYPINWQTCGVLHLARDAAHEAKQAAAVKALDMPPEFVEYVDAIRATQLAGYPVHHGGWWFAQGAWVEPATLCQANLAAITPRVSLMQSSVARIEYHKNEWFAFNTNAEIIAHAPHLILANGHDARRLLNADWLPLRAARGQLSHLPQSQIPPLKVVVCGQGYVTPSNGDWAATGASFITDDTDLELRDEEHQENLDKLNMMLPGYAKNLLTQTLQGRVSLRPISRDRLPIVGAIPNHSGLYILSGFGARGLTWANICAELLASQINGDPLPLESDLVAALDPARYQ